MSLILRPEKLPFENLAFVTTWAAVAVCGAVEEVTGKKPSVKWINDLLLDGKKICGILTEGVMDFESGSIGWIVLGIGVNVRSKPEDFAEELFAVEDRFGVHPLSAGELKLPYLDKPVCTLHEQAALAVGDNAFAVQPERTLKLGMPLSLIDLYRLPVHRSERDRRGIHAPYEIVHLFFGS